MTLLSIVHCQDDFGMGDGGLGGGLGDMGSGGGLGDMGGGLGGLDNLGMNN